MEKIQVNLLKPLNEYLTNLLFIKFNEPDRRHDGKYVGRIYGFVILPPVPKKGWWLCEFQEERKTFFKVKPLQHYTTLRWEHGWPRYKGQDLPTPHSVPIYGNLGNEFFNLDKASQCDNMWLIKYIHGWGGTQQGYVLFVPTDRASYVQQHLQLEGFDKHGEKWIKKTKWFYDNYLKAHRLEWEKGEVQMYEQIETMFKWDDIHCEVRKVDGDRTLWIWFPDDEEVSLIFEEEDFLSGNLNDFISTKGKGYEIVEWPSRTETHYYFQKSKK